MLMKTPGNEVKNVFVWKRMWKRSYKFFHHTTHTSKWGKTEANMINNERFPASIKLQSVDGHSNSRLHGEVEKLQTSHFYANLKTFATSKILIYPIKKS